jgi:TPR repeat protein
MKRITVILLSFIIFFTFGALEAMAVISEGPFAGGDLKRKAVKLLYQADYDSLERLAKDLRDSKARFADGAWKLNVFYSAFSEPREEDKVGWERFLSKLDNWHMKYPDSVTAKCAAAKGWISYAKLARGEGYADTVTEEGWKLFYKRLQRAYPLIEKAPPGNSRDCPERLSMLMGVLNAAGGEKSSFDFIFNRAIAFEPLYYYYYINKAIYLMPRWHGEAGDWQRFAEEAIPLSPKSEGMANYTRIIINMANNKEFTSFKKAGVSWPKMKQGFYDLQKNFPASLWNMNLFCKFASAAGDKQTAQRLFASIDYPYLTVWAGKREEFQKISKWAGVEGSHIKEAAEVRDSMQMAKDGDVHAQYELGYIYKMGEMATQDDKEAFRWFKLAADKGYPPAQAYLGGMYYYGKAVPLNEKEAVKWFHLAAEQGNAYAQRLLANAYEGGFGIAKDPIKAYAWHEQLPFPKNAPLEQLAKKLTPEQISKGKEEAELIRKSMKAKRDNNIAAY